MAKKGKSVFFKIIVITGVLLILAGIFTAYKAYTILYKSNVKLDDKNSTYLYIKTGSDFNEVLNQLNTNKIISDASSFEWLADYKDYKNHVKPGKYTIKNGMNNNELINMLMSGRQEPVKLVFNNVRTKYQLAGKMSSQLEADSLSIIELLDNADYLDSLGFTVDNAIAVFIPNTYELYWNTSAKQLFEKMKKEFDKFWNNSRKTKAENAGLSPVEVEILASIIQEESRKYDEMPTIAGVYINRLNKGMKLEADPTVKFAIGDFSIKRILKKHLLTDSPYNTYQNKGLPPGPICLPDSRIIDKVLNYEKHNYLFFCAKPDGSGYHSFAKTSAEHSRNAQIYHQYLNTLKIK
ncbi:MAG TPA: endolytic transglycosylase MltG [Bacteroidales bacterium]|nr:endolytic transglycosylase MltG [Bacteroidales bacterium]HPS15610.1 endolytic transglycosylase MltG [Bacteroidales bacterium]